MLNCVIRGEQDAEALAELARGRLRAKLPDLRLALEGRVQPHHQFLLQQILAHTDFLEQSIDAVQQEIDKRLAPYQEAVRLIQSLPVQLQAGAATVIAEIGVDMTRFPVFRAFSLMGWCLPRQLRERRQTEVRQND